MGVLYRSQAVLTSSAWLDKFEDIMSYITAHWDGLVLITGDMNFDLLGIPDAPKRRYLSLLDTFSVKQVINQLTRITKNSRTLIDHFIVNDTLKVTATGVIPFAIVSDHDGPFASYQPRYKYLRNLKNVDEKAFLNDFAALPVTDINL